MLRRELALLALIAGAGCSVVSQPSAPEPRLVAIETRPVGAALALDCGGKEVEHIAPPARVYVPPEPCTMTVSAAGYQPMRIAFNADFVRRFGRPLHDDNHHVLSESATPVDVFLFPLQKLGDRMQNSIDRKRAGADYALLIELRRQ